MFTKGEYLKLSIFIIVIIFLVFIQYYTSDYLERASIPIINYLQKDSYFVEAMVYVSLIGAKILKKFFVVITFCLCNSYHSFIYVIVTYSSTFLGNCLKIHLQEPRPFWIDRTVKSFECESGYGYPSDHVLTTVPSILMMYEIMYYRFELDKSVNSKIFYYVGIGTASIVCISVGFSRLVVGVHSLDQVVFGLLLGFLIYFFYLHIIDFDLKDHKSFLSMISNKFQIYKFLFFFFLFYLLYLISMINLEVIYKYEWLVIIKELCTEGIYNAYYRSLIISGEYFIILGSFLGLLYDFNYNYQDFNLYGIPKNYVYLNLSDCNNDIRVGKWNDTNVFKSFLRIIFISFEMLALLILCSYLLQLFENPYTDVLMDRMLPSFLCGFIIFGFVKNQSTFLGLSGLNRRNIKQS